MTIERAAIMLQAHLGLPSWLTAIGVGEVKGSRCIIVYVKDPKSDVIAFPNGWKGFPVVIRKMSAPRPAQGVRKL